MASIVDLEKKLRYCRLLRGKDIKKFLDDETLFVGPLLEPGKHIGPIGIDLRLDTYFLEIKHTGKGLVDPFERSDPYESTELIEVDFFGGGYTLQPGKFVVGQTFEYISLHPRIFGILDGRSSLGRLGIVVHSTAMSVDPGWAGHLTLELHNNGEMPVKLSPLIRVARLILFETPGTDPEVEESYSSLADAEKKYYRQVRPTPSRIYDDEDLKDLKQISRKFEQANADLRTKYFPNG